MLIPTQDCRPGAKFRRPFGTREEFSHSLQPPVGKCDRGSGNSPSMAGSAFKLLRLCYLLISCPQLFYATADKPLRTLSKLVRRKVEEQGNDQSAVATAPGTRPLGAYAPAS